MDYEYYRAIAEIVADIKPRVPPSALYEDAMLLSGLEPMRVTKETNFVNIGKCCEHHYISCPFFNINNGGIWKE